MTTAPKPMLPDLNCSICPRLKAFIDENRKLYPDYYNAPVMPFGDDDPQLLIVGLAPGLKGANQTGRPFTGDYAGDLLYGSLLKYGFAKGEYKARPDDGLQLVNAHITNAVKCVPPQNKPIGAEINNCRPFLISEINAMTNLKAILCLGKISHDTTLRLFGQKLSAHPFAHCAHHDVMWEHGKTAKAIRIFDSYHCSRYNTNTRRLTEEMFHIVFENIVTYVKGQ